MYSNIKCSKEHKRCFIPEKTREKLKNAKTTAMRVATIGGVFLVLASFTACSGAKEIKKDIETTRPQVETTIENETTKYEIPTTEVSTTEVSTTEVLTTEATKKEITTSTQEQTTTIKPPETTKQAPSTTKEQITEAKKELKVVTIEPTAKKYSKDKLNKILEKVNRVLETKDYSGLAKRFIREGVEQIFNNYNLWSAVNKDFPTIEEYIDQKIIPGIKNASSIKMIDIQSKEAQKMLNTGDALAATRGEDCDIYLIYNNPETCSKEQHIGDLELLFHELAHCQNKNILFTLDNFLEDEELSEIYKEGGATMHMDLINPLSANHQATAVITNSEGNKTVEYGKDNGLGYMLDLYIYRNLVYLAGYKTVESVGQGKDITVIKDKIEERYGYDLSENIWVGLCNLYSNYNYRNDSNESFKDAINLQNNILECVKQDIQKLDVNNKEQIKAFMDIYRNFKINLMPQVLKNDYEDISSNYFDTDSLDELLIKKVEKAGIYKLTSNKDRNHMIIKTMLLANCNNYGENDFIYLPPAIAGTKYEFYEDNGGHLIMTYTDEKGEEIQLGADFNDKEITKISKSYGIEYIKDMYLENNSDKER